MFSCYLLVAQVTSPVKVGGGGIIPSFKGFVLFSIKVKLQPPKVLLPRGDSV